MDRIKIVENNIAIPINELKAIIIDEWQNDKFYNQFYLQGNRGVQLYQFILSEIDDYADAVVWGVTISIREKLNRPEEHLDWDDLYPKSDLRSIGFEVLRLLSSVCLASDIEELITDDIPTILEFLDTTSDKSLEAWDKWEKYWANLDYTARRKKLLEDPKYNNKHFYSVKNKVEKLGSIEQAEDMVYLAIKNRNSNDIISQINEVVYGNTLVQFNQSKAGSSCGLSGVNVSKFNNLCQNIQARIQAFEKPNHPRIVRDILRDIEKDKA